MFYVCRLAFSVAKKPMLNDGVPEEIHTPAELRKAQWAVVKNPYLWILGLSSAFMYMSRYAMESWGVLCLQEVGTYTLVNAGFLFFVSRGVETMGTACCGFVSDFFFSPAKTLPPWPMAC